MSVNKNDKNNAVIFGKAQGGHESADGSRMIHKSFSWYFDNGSIQTDKGSRFDSLSGFKNSSYFKKK